MKKINIKGLDQVLYYSKLKNGLELYLIPNENRNRYYMSLNVKFGSNDTEFKYKNEKQYRKIPNGVAHFLEHLTFKTEEGDASLVFSSLGSYSNAYTSNDITSYEVIGHTLFKENLEYLLDFVQIPFYNNEVVEAEKGIICEEIKMYKDSVYSIIDDKINKNIYINDHHQYLVSGTIKDVKSTTLDDINTAYNYFYQPSNMYVVITGNFNPAEAEAIISENQDSKTFKPYKEVIKKKTIEPYEVHKKECIFNEDTNITRAFITYKCPIKNINLKESVLQMYLIIMLNSKFGRTSLLKEELIKNKIIVSGLMIDLNISNGYIYITLGSETEYPKKLLKILKEEMERLNISKEDFVRKQRVFISTNIEMFDDIESVAELIKINVLKYNNPLENTFDDYQNLKYEKINDIVKQLNTKLFTTFIFKKKQK